jgi:hypothetical protein
MTDQISHPSTNVKKQSRSRGRHRANVWDRRKLARMHKGRHGTHSMADDAASRAMLVVLLHCGLSLDDACERGPWIKPELPANRARYRH